ncbi:hypothetical protein B0T25DRAFT_598478 [Lasiosphaeria hispida]|uniref:Extracellular membrane protein CFEM domain-containing protein n=1 Tax=Lasiosphaeria hispida TaxID=260671 RepID=A0AAJ0ML17_9PEZI|nr:hypothetical protein B0T25DRAFT_598478 [Lasiosphaeria hispida]
MKFLTTALLTLAGASLAQAQSPLTCPTATRTVQSRACRRECDFSDCNFTQTLRNPCGCPAAVPTATLIAPCEAECPYQGCGIEFRTSALACPPPTTSSTRRQLPTSRGPTTTARATTTQVATTIITLPPVSRSTPCPTITRTTSPADCPAIRCPVPTCQVGVSVVVPCNCTPKTLLLHQQAWRLDMRTVLLDFLLSGRDTARIAP